MHTLEEVDGVWVSDDVGWRFTCTRTDHVETGPYTWLSPPPPAGHTLSGIAIKLRLSVPRSFGVMGSSMVPIVAHSRNATTLSAQCHKP